MSYYQGDFYRGGRMQGDPGFFSFLGGLAKKAAGFIPGVGPAVSTALSVIPKGGGMKAAGSMIRAGAGRAVAVVKKHPVLSAAGAAGMGGLAAGVGGTALAMHAHGGAAGGRRRRMRVTNPKALRRALRRTQGFAKLAMRTIHIVHPRKKGRFGGFKKRTRRAA